MNILSPSKLEEKAAGLFEVLEGETNFVPSPIYIYILKKKKIFVLKRFHFFFPIRLLHNNFRTLKPIPLVSLQTHSPARPS